jgi:hypothetical protein
MHFTSTTQIVFSLSTSGQSYATGDSSIGLFNLTDNLHLLSLSATSGDGYPYDLSGFFTFTLEPSKVYRLSAYGSTPASDFGWASVSYSVRAVPEPSSLTFMLLSFGALGIARRKFIKLRLGGPAAIR